MNLICAYDNAYGIGYNNQIPNWNLVGDLKTFKEKTIGKGNNCVIMGKNTFLSLNRNILLKRTNIIVSSTMYKSFLAENNINNDNTIIKVKDNLIYMQDINTAYNYAINNFDQLWLIGGAQLYEAAVNASLVKEIHITYVNKKYNCNCYLLPNTIEFINKNLNQDCITKYINNVPTPYYIISNLKCI